VVANNWNPNAVSPDKMHLLQQSIIDNGWCFPIVVIWDADSDRYIIIDGFHRWTIAQPDWLDLPEVPVVVLPHSIAQRMIATVQFNKARGVHQVDLDAELIRGLIEQGMSEEQISEHLGIDLDTVHRYKQVTGIAELFKDVDYSTSWRVVDE
jgi:ParB-like chromosome segregation protein Spo0J